jgi:hypothetical protein
MNAESLGRCVTGDGWTPVYPWVAHPYRHCKRQVRPYTLPHVFRAAGDAYSAQDARAPLSVGCMVCQKLTRTAVLPPPIFLYFFFLIE